MIFGTNKNKTGFTLIELLVVISIISITTLGVTRIDFNRISNEQRLDIFTNEIASQIETVRNNALIGKGVGTNIITPDEWRIQVNNISPGSLQTSYYTGGSWINSNDYSVAIASGYSISSINCTRLDNTSESITGATTLTINGSNISLSGCSDDTFKILEITTGYQGFEKIVSVNTLSGLIEMD